MKKRLTRTETTDAYMSESDIVGLLYSKRRIRMQARAGLAIKGNLKVEISISNPDPAYSQRPIQARRLIPTVTRTPDYR